MTENHASKRWLAAGIVAGGALALALLLAAAQPAAADLPPRPTVEEPEKRSAPCGGTIALHAQFPPGWPWDAAHWQDVWTLVQWQDPHTGVWRDVEGWRGELDTVTTADGAVVGQKGWWVAQKDLGSGPFRWQVYESRGGRLLGTSRPFDLPSASGVTVTVEVVLGP